ncbi:porin [Xylella taiwanensis]|uniref:Porin n=1 Tax=Xylella taiwanensis TaxID=1444770 RepID=Z9JL86_9GAMM|nr:porin [Xylella taiwanensis]AXI82745.1 porin [Xylella taiwanensis]EWS78561.1 porin [Xylella taiwanensis]MCD8455751.1 porin [Xylella taiwanensis]MCD8458156.1 porin [Xylella taiwanensis]MCD8460292.1 porin [Xylella taiwanensis]
MRPIKLLFTLCMTSTASAVIAADMNHWPVQYTFGNKTEAALTGNFAYDYNNFSGDNRLEDKSFMRRKELGVVLKKKNAYDALVSFDFQSKLWLDVFFRFETKALFDQDYGRVRLGYIKTPVGLDALISSRSGSFMESALPVQAIYEGRRTGVEWVLERPQYLLQAGAYGGKDLQGDNPGTTQGIRAIWTPIKTTDNVLHLGLSYSQENPRGYHNGLNVPFSPRTRVRARPESGLTDIRLVDSGTLVDVDQIQRNGLEQLWIKGPCLVQSEALHIKIARNNGLPTYNANGQYIYGSWIVTGESRPYTAGTIGNVIPVHNYGAVELLARYSRLNLDDGTILGGRQHDWTIGTNWYLTNHFKFQANYVKANVSRLGTRTKPDIFELRAQVYF